jgi:Cu(I)/Ag(I) efflux system protein CusF
MNRRTSFAIAVSSLLILVASAPMAPACAQTPNASGEVTKIDKPGLRVTIKHGEIKNLDMPPMTMVFRVRDAKLLDELVPGDRVRFAAERIDGSYTVTSLNKTP